MTMLTKKLLFLISFLIFPLDAFGLTRVFGPDHYKWNVYERSWDIFYSTDADPLNSGSTNYIQNRTTLQSGATFYVSSGTVTNLSATTGTLTAILWADGTVQVSSPQVRSGSTLPLPEGSTYYASQAQVNSTSTYILEGNATSYVTINGSTQTKTGGLQINSKLGVGTTPTSGGPRIFGFNSVSGGGGVFRANTWADFSASICGNGLMGGNLYLNYPDNTYYAANSHASVGGSGIEFNGCIGASTIRFLTSSTTTVTTANTPHTMAERMRITRLGNVGINTGSPSSRLHIVGDITASSGAYTSGPVGIGTTAPSSRLDVSGGSITVRGTNAGIVTTGDVVASSLTLSGNLIMPVSSSRTVGAMYAGSYENPAFFTWPDNGNSIQLGNGSQNVNDTGSNNFVVFNAFTGLVSPDGGNNIGIGPGSGSGAVTGALNIALGNGAWSAGDGDYNVVIGYSAGGSMNARSSKSTFIGTNADYDSELQNVGAFYATGIGADSVVACSTCIILGNGTMRPFVGIGISSPSSLLDIFNGSITVNGTNSGLAIRGGSAKNSIVLGTARNQRDSYIEFAAGDTDASPSRAWNIGVPYSQTQSGTTFYSFVIDDQGSGTIPELMVKFNSGNVGIGTDNPSSKLDVVGGSITVRGANAGLMIASGTVNVNDIQLGTPYLSAAGYGMVLAKTQYGLNIQQEQANSAIGLLIDNKANAASSTWMILVRDNNAATTLFSVDGAGAITKVSGSFLIDHPDPQMSTGTKLRHYLVEAPTPGENLYRWTVTVSSSLTSTITLPGYFKWLNENPQAWITPVKHFGRAYGEFNAESTELKIVADAEGVYNVMAVGTRKDQGAVDVFNHYGVEYKEDSERNVTKFDPKN